MAAISAANTVAITDKLAAHWLQGLAGMGTVGDTSKAYKKSADLISLVIGLNDEDQILSLLSDARQMRSDTDAVTSVGKATSTFFKKLDEEAKRSGTLLGQNIADLNAFALYYNTGAGGPWNCLFAPDFRDAFYAAKKVYPDAKNVYFEVLQGATFNGVTFTNALRKLVVSGSVQTAGQDIDSTKYAGGVGQVNVSGLSGTGLVTVTGTWRASDGTVSTASGTATVSGNGVTVLTPPTSNALLLTVTGITVAAGITAGTIYAEAKRPTGRTNPPV